MGIEAAEGPGDGGPGADDGAIDVEREPRQRQARQGVEYDLLIKPDQGSEPRLREPAQPVGDRARRRQPGQPAESTDERVADEILLVLYPPRPDVEQRQQQQTQPRPAVVATEGGARAAQSWIQAEPAHVAMEQLEPAVRRQLLRHELDRQISLDHLPQAAYAQTHQRGLRERKSDVGTSALLIRGEAPLMHFSCRSIPVLFSDWGPSATAYRSSRCQRLSVTLMFEENPGSMKRWPKKLASPSCVRLPTFFHETLSRVTERLWHFPSNRVFSDREAL